MGFGIATAGMSCSVYYVLRRRCHDQICHNNFNVLNLEKSLQFYKDALNLTEVRRVEKPDFTLVYLGDNGETPHLLELTWLKDRTEPYDLGEDEFHLAFVTDDIPTEMVTPSGLGVLMGIGAKGTKEMPERFRGAKEATGRGGRDIGRDGLHIRLAE